jgi:hypothetical protein
LGVKGEFHLFPYMHVGPDGVEIKQRSEKHNREQGFHA